ncbi:MAG: magnesium transporter [Alphaproteobacteria bacterium]|nr:magnesium transporter [Alphaproteobacteria bacterium]
MTGNPATAAQALDQRFFLDYPWEAARLIDQLPPDDVLPSLSQQTARVLLPLWQRLSPTTAVSLLRRLPDALVKDLLTELPPNHAVNLITSLENDEQESRLNQLDPHIAAELRGLMAYPEESAGRLMDTRVLPFRDDATAAEVLERLRQTAWGNRPDVYVVDDNNKLTARVSLQDLAIASPEATLGSLAKPIRAAVTAISPRDEAVQEIERFRLFDLPVVDLDGVLVGAIRHDAIVHAVHEAAIAEIQTMVGASKDERALSKPGFAVRKRLPWLQINLLTAFMAAAVVGLFEDMIARFTALAVLLPVVAGQSGNAGAQALAVTMRGLALREITLRHWLAVTLKEMTTGFMNGVAVAITCGIGVYVWSGSVGLVLVIALSMVLAMVAAGLAGALVPITLTRFGQDPAQSSSIILTTVTDVAGFFSFLGIATLLASLL